ncbi:MAG: hypothetical protein NC133_04735, partial [Prevotella sp.]|nr:hypothetical protein [Prevotella sp.]
MKFYGDEYVYYYKGHPNSPTDQYPVRAQLLKDMGLIDIESTIAAELILFFFPDISMSGYSSTTFNSVQNEAMACIFFGKTKQAALADTGVQNGNMFDAYITTVAAHGTTYDQYCTVAEHKYFVVEFNEHNTEGYSFAIYDSTLNNIKFYNVAGEVVAEK